MTTDTGFNLLDEPWIIALEPDGREAELSILDLFERAEELVAIGGEVPTQGFAITRMLLAFLHRALDGPADTQAWANLWTSRTLPMTQIRGYADRVRHRFDLFDDEAPFFQVPSLRTAKGDVSGLEKIVADVPNGEPMFTTRSAASLERIDAGEAARWLVHVHAFDPSGIKSGAVGDPTVKGGKGYPIGIGWAGQLGGILAEGRNLRETLLLNLIARDVESYVHLGDRDDIPPWERAVDGPTWDDDRPPRGAVDLYTWQTRRVRLHGDRRGVTGVVLANGDKIQPQNRHQVEPHSAWRFSEPQTKKFKRPTYMPRALEPGRSIWRGLEALLPSVSGRHSRSDEPQRFLAPGVMQWIGELVAAGHVTDDYVVRTHAVGARYGTQNARFDEIVDDRLALGVVLLREDSPALGRLAQAAVEDAERIATVLGQLARNIARAAGADGDTGAGDRARERLYAALEAPYRAWLANLGPSSETTAARLEWQSTILTSVRPLASELVEVAGPAAWIGRAVNKRHVNVARAETWFNAELRKALQLAFHHSAMPLEEVAS